MLFKLLIILILAMILYSLGSALYYLVYDKEDSMRMVKALTWRIGLSIGLFCLLLIAYRLGWIAPHPV